MTSAVSSSSSPTVSSSPVSCTTLRPSTRPNLSCQSAWRSCTSALMGPAHASNTTETAPWSAPAQCRYACSKLLMHSSCTVAIVKRCRSAQHRTQGLLAAGPTQVDGLVAAVERLELLVWPGCVDSWCCWCCGGEVLAEQAQHGQLLQRAYKPGLRHSGRQGRRILCLCRKAAVRTMTPVLPAPVGADTTCRSQQAARVLSKPAARVAHVLPNYPGGFKCLLP